MSTRTRLGLLAAAAYVAVVVLANVLSSRYGMVSVGFGLVASAGTYAAGAALGMRDARAGRPRPLGCPRGHRCRLGPVVLARLPVIATASLAAFVASELCDLAVYTPLRERGWSRAVIASNVVGAVVDTWVFLTLAPFGPVTFHAMEGQLVGKILWATLLPVALVAGVRKVREA
jgi:hypothetical protein